MLLRRSGFTSLCSFMFLSCSLFPFSTTPSMSLPGMGFPTLFSDGSSTP